MLGEYSFFEKIINSQQHNNNNKTLMQDKS